MLPCARVKKAIEDGKLGRPDPRLRGHVWLA